MSTFNPNKYKSYRSAFNGPARTPNTGYIHYIRGILQNNSHLSVSEIVQDKSHYKNYLRTLNGTQLAEEFKFVMQHKNAAWKADFIHSYLEELQKPEPEELLGDDYFQQLLDSV